MIMRFALDNETIPVQLKGFSDIFSCLKNTTCLLYGLAINFHYLPLKNECFETHDSSVLQIIPMKNDFIKWIENAEK